MIRGGLLCAVLAGAWVIPAAAFGQASFGPIQPFAGAPSPVYVAGPYAAPTVLAPIGGPIMAPQVYGAGPPQIHIPPATLPPTLGAAPGIVSPLQTTVASPSCGCGGGSQPYYRPHVGAPTTSYSPYAAPGAATYGGAAYGYPAHYGAGQAFPGYGP